MYDDEENETSNKTTQSNTDPLEQNLFKNLNEKQEQLNKIKT